MSLPHASLYVPLSSAERFNYRKDKKINDKTINDDWTSKLASEKICEEESNGCSNYAKSNGMVYHQLVSMHDNE